MELDRRIRWTRRLAVLSVALTLVLMVLGAWVKANGAGLACPDWPRCYGQWLPPFPSRENGGVDLDGGPVYYSQAEIMYEWTHRAVVSVLLVPLVALVAVSRGPDLRPALRRLPAVALGLYFFQALLGAVTVATKNPPWATTAHLATAALFLVLLTVTTCIAYLRPVAEPEVRRVVLPPRPAPEPTGYVYADARPAPRIGAK